MRIVVARKRIRGTLPHYEYRVFIPFEEISIERQNLIHIRSDYGFSPGPWARVYEVIAPMSHLRLPPGVDRYRQSMAIRTVAQRIEAAIVRHVFPEMTAAAVPIVFIGDADHPDRIVQAGLRELTARFEHFATHEDAVTRDHLELVVQEEQPA